MRQIDKLLIEQFRGRPVLPRRRPMLLAAVLAVIAIGFILWLGWLIGHALEATYWD